MMLKPHRLCPNKLLCLHKNRDVCCAQVRGGKPAQRGGGIGGYAQIGILGSIWSNLRGFRGGAGIRRRQNADALSVALRRFYGVRAVCCFRLAEGWPVRADRRIILFRLFEQGVGIEPDHLLAEPFIDVFQRLHCRRQFVDGINPRRLFNVTE